MRWAGGKKSRLFAAGSEGIVRKSAEGEFCPFN
jgi:hypothetical protein